MGTTPTLDINAYVNAANQAEKDQKPFDDKKFFAPVAPVVPEPKEPVGDDDTDDADEKDSVLVGIDGKPLNPGKTDRERREYRKAIREAATAREQAAEARGKLAAMEELMSRYQLPVNKPAEVAPVTDSKPTRDKFPAGEDGAAQYAAEMGAWGARQQVANSTAAQAELDALKSKVNASAAFFEEEKEFIPDIDNVIKKLESPEYNISGEKNPAVWGLLSTTPFRGHICEFLVKDIKLLEKLKALESDPVEQRDFFKRLEGRAESLYDVRKETKAKETAVTNGSKGGDPIPSVQQTAAERDAQKALPSTAVSPRGGSGVPIQEMPQTIEVNGQREINPVWYEKENQKYGLKK